ncbi:DNA primase [Carnobacterium pleistocenium]|uniref:DNA primase n=1 Tax=Carnobacterium pleistocenium TaxID=181073 RepID=UPI0018DE8F7D|nr:DNA primase [Carnobacterium pleistocenium]
MIPEETVNKIRQETNIVDVVSQYVQLKKKGKNLFGFCPFHEERTASFSVTEEKQIFHCFSCGRGGNVFTFLMEVDGLTFPEAVIKTAELSQFQLDESLVQDQDHKNQTTDSTKEKLIRVHEESAELFHHILLNTKIGEDALEYLTQRGLTRDVIDTFNIGFAPRERTMLQQYLMGKNIEQDVLKKTGLFVEKDNGDLLDRFYNRIIFPIRNQQGKTVAFSGRIFQQDADDGAPKYLNSPETQLFNKRMVLFNFDLARPSIRREKEVILFEGFMDVIAAWKVGVTNGIASMGTSLTNEQIHLIDRVTDHVLIAYDGDPAGIEATKRASDLLAAETNFDIDIIRFAEGMDPDEHIKKNGAAAFNELIAHGRETLFGFKMAYYRKALNLSNESERLGYIEKILSELLSVTSAVERELYFKQLANEFELSIDSLKEQFQQKFHDSRNQRTKEKQQQQQHQKQAVEINYPQVHMQKRKPDNIEYAERLLLNRLFHFEEAWIIIKNDAADFHFVHDEYQMLFILYESFREHTDNEGPIDAFIDFVKESELKSLIVEIELLSISNEISTREVEDYLDVISRKSVLQMQLKEKQEALTEASRRGDKEQLRVLMIEVVNLSRLLKNK